MIALDLSPQTLQIIEQATKKWSNIQDFSPSVPTKKLYQTATNLVIQ
ncbi:hypothetical protein [Moraxella cuniculi]|uniref:Uncharacterized protein n=1 Tax=Moraxella cuniculi TaxID=34061 RepID=A0A448GY47_9GAMM|nr:hypothetical protein [Moraxella cuniculi]VEG13717.1 Uncharacterised protein [Moraxella cuniculi]